MQIKIHRRKFRLKKKDIKRIKIFIIILSFLVLSLVIVPLFLIKCCPGEEEQVPEFSVGSTGNTTILVYRCGDKINVELNLEEYIAGVVAGEMPSSFEMEALKAQAVAARTYALSKAFRGEQKGNSAEHFSAPLCDSTHCQVYRSESELRELKGEGWMNDGWLKIKEAVGATKGQVMYYEGALVEQPLFHSSSGGRTENSEDVFVSALPYLRSVESAYEEEAPHTNESIYISMSSFREKMNVKFGAKNIKSDNIKILLRSDGGRVKEIQVGDKVLKGREIRDALGLRSADFSMDFDGNEGIIFTTHGYGHGVGMSQWGANGMAKAGFGYEEILKHYYQGVSIR